MTAEEWTVNCMKNLIHEYYSNKSIDERIMYRGAINELIRLNSERSINRDNN